MKRGDLVYVVIPVCAVVVLIVGRLQMIYVLDVHPGPAGYVIPILVGSFFGYLIARVLRLRYQLKAALERAEKSASHIAELNKELARRVEEKSHALDETQGQLQQAQRLDALGRLAGGVAHDFNNLLTVIVTGGSILARGARSAPEKRIVDDMVQAARRGAELTRQLLAFSRPGTSDPRVLAVGEVVGEVLPMLQRLLGKDVVISWTDPGELPPVFVDAGQLGQVLMNLAINARDAMPEGGTVRLSGSVCERAGESWVCLTVADSGVGMDEETRQKAVEPFFSTKPPGKGTGLGLWVAYGIVRNSGGRLMITSEPGVGTKMTIELPAARELPASPSDDVERAAPDPAKETVLVIDDDEAVLGMVARALTSGGYTVLSATSGSSAVDLVRHGETPISLVVCDVVLAGEWGPDVAATVLRQVPDAALLFMSGYAQDGIEDQGLTPEPLISKPFEVSDILRRAGEAIERRRRIRSCRDPTRG